MRWPFSRPLQPTLTRLTAERAAACAEIHARFFARAWDRGEIERMIADPATLADAALDGQGRALLGFAISRLVRPEAELLTIAVSGAAQGRGVGKVLLGAHMARLAAAGATHLFLEVDEKNAPALALYGGFGFVEVGRRPGYYALRDGSRATALVMRAELG